MTVWIALLRGINVGGHRKVPMAELRALAADLVLKDAVTYVQSGNLIFRTPVRKQAEIEARLAKGIEDHFGFQSGVMARCLADWESAIAANPFPEAANAPKTLHAFFLADRPQDGAAERLAASPRSDEAFAIVGDTLYLLTPSGLGTSKFAASIERRLGQPATARNWNSVMKIADLGRSLG